MRPIEPILARVEHKRVRPGVYSFRVPTREDKHWSGRLRECDDGRVLLWDFGGDNASDILDAIGLTLADLFPKPELGTHHFARLRRPFMPADIFDVARLEVGVVAMVAADMHAGRTITAEDFERVLTAAGRLSRIAEAAYAR